MHPYFWFFWYIPRSGIARLYENSRFSFLRNCHIVFPQQLQHFTFPPEIPKGSNFFTSLPTLTVLCYFYKSHPNECEIESHWVLIYRSLVICDVKHIFMSLLSYSISSLEKCLFNYSFKNCCCSHRVLHTFWISTLYQICDLQIFYPILCAAFSHYWQCPLIQKILKIWCSLYYLLLLLLMCFWYHSQEIIAKSSIMKLFSLLFFSNSFSFYIEIFGPFWVSFCVLCKVRVQGHSFACGYSAYSTSFVEKTPFVIEWSWHNGRKLFDHICKGLFLCSMFYSIGLNVCVYASIIVLKFEIRTCGLPALFFCFKMVLAIQGPLQVHINFRMDF